MPSSLIVVASALLSLAAAAPVTDGVGSGPLEDRQAPNCKIGTMVGDASLYDSTCWDTLNLGSYLTKWSSTTPTCTDAGQTLSCCVASEPWSTCFLRLATQQSNLYDCTKVIQAPGSSSVACTFPSDLDPALDPTIASQVNYILLNIMMINKFFSNYYTALQDVFGTETEGLNSLQSKADSVQFKVSDVRLNSQNVMAALTLGLAFPEVTTAKVQSFSSDGTTVTGTSMSKRDSQSSSTNSSRLANLTITPCNKSWITIYFNTGRHHRRGEASGCSSGTANTDSASAATGLTLGPNMSPVIIFNQALQQSPNVAEAMWPSPPNGATDTLPHIIANLASDGRTASILNAGLHLIMSDIGTFIAFASHGIFSTPLANTDLPTAYLGYSGALDTYILSQILQRNSIYAQPGDIVPTNPCTGTYLCSGIYWSPVTHRRYSIKGSSTGSFIAAAAKSMNVDLGVLFDGAYNCTFAGQAGESVASLNTDWSLNMACMSVLPIYITGDCPQGAVFVNGKCPFGYWVT